MSLYFQHLRLLRKRIDKFGVTQPNIQRLGNSGRILVELPGAKDVERITKLLQSTAQLEFWNVYKFEDMAGFLSQANEKVKELKGSTASEKEEATETTDSSMTSEEAAAAAQKDSTATDDQDISKLLRW